METESKKNGKIGIIIGAVAAVVVIAVVLIFVLGKKDNAYRIIKIFEYAGEGIVRRENIGELEPYENMVLESGDYVTLNTGTMTLKLDEDKYVYVDEQTEFSLEASGTAANSKTKIQLEVGTLLNDIQQPLSNDSSYEINTPNSSMSVRGTLFMAQEYVDENGVHYTKVSTFHGAVATRLVYADGTVSDKEALVEGGKEAIIYQDDSTTDYVVESQDIDYTQLPPTVIKALIKLAENGDIDLPITKEELEEILEEIEETEKGPFTVTFYYQDAVFGTQTVEKGNQAGIPKLMPAETGSWDFDFSTPIDKDTDIYWK